MGSGPGPRGGEPVPWRGQNIIQQSAVAQSTADDAAVLAAIWAALLEVLDDRSIYPQPEDRFWRFTGTSPVWVCVFRS